MIITIYGLGAGKSSEALVFEEVTNVVINESTLTFTYTSDDISYDARFNLDKIAGFTKDSK